MNNRIWPDNFINRIINDDCLRVMPQIPDKSIDMILCDLPYGVTARNKWDNIIPFEDLWINYNRIIKDNGVIVLTAIQPFASLLVASNIDNFKYEWIWEKDNGTGFLNAKKQPLRSHEQVLVFYKKQCIYNPQMFFGEPYKQLSGRASTNYNEQVQVITDNDGKRYPKTVQKFKRDTPKLHPTQKPLALFEYLIKTYTNENDIVLDNTCGSGTTCLAAINTNRNFIGIEMDENYYNIALERLAIVSISNSY